MSELQLSPAGRRYGAYRSPFDPRDFDFKRFQAFLTATCHPVPPCLPKSTNNRIWCGPTRDQGQEGSCTGHAGRGARIFLANKYQKINNALDFSPAELYWLERQKDGTLADGDCGSTGRTCCQVLTSEGVCPESDDPYKAGDFNQAPSSVDLEDGLKWKAGAYHSIFNVADMKSCMSSGYPFITGFTVYSSFEGQQLAETGFMPVPDKGTEQVLGGHEVLFVDYDDTIKYAGWREQGAFLVQNSWGTDWALDGKFWFPYECAADKDIWMDSQIIHLGKPW